MAGLLESLGFSIRILHQQPYWLNLSIQERTWISSDSMELISIFVSDDDIDVSSIHVNEMTDNVKIVYYTHEDTHIRHIINIIGDNVDLSYIGTTSEEYPNLHLSYTWKEFLQIQSSENQYDYIERNYEQGYNIYKRGFTYVVAVSSRDEGLYMRSSIGDASIYVATLFYPDDKDYLEYPEWEGLYVDSPDEHIDAFQQGYPYVLQHNEIDDIVVPRLKELNHQLQQVRMHLIMQIEYDDGDMDRLCPPYYQSQLIAGKWSVCCGNLSYIHSSCDVDVLI